MSTTANHVWGIKSPIPLYPKIYPRQGIQTVNVHTFAPCWSICPATKKITVGYRGIGFRERKIILQSSYAPRDTDTRALFLYHPLPIPHIPLYPNIYRIRYNKGKGWGIGWGINHSTQHIPLANPTLCPVNAGSGAMVAQVKLSIKTSPLRLRVCVHTGGTSRATV